MTGDVSYDGVTLQCKAVHVCPLGEETDENEECAKGVKWWEWWDDVRYAELWDARLASAFLYSRGI